MAKRRLLISLFWFDVKLAFAATTTESVVIYVESCIIALLLIAIAAYFTYQKCRHSVEKNEQQNDTAIDEKACTIEMPESEGPNQTENQSTVKNQALRMEPQKKHQPQPYLKFQKQNPRMQSRLTKPQFHNSRSKQLLSKKSPEQKKNYKPKTMHKTFNSNRIDHHQSISRNIGNQTKILRPPRKIFSIKEKYGILHSLDKLKQLYTKSKFSFRSKRSP
jgi:hypothetical protein